MPEPLTIPTERELAEWEVMGCERLTDSSRLIASLRLLLAEHRAAVEHNKTRHMSNPRWRVAWDEAVALVEAAMPKEPK